MSGGIDVRRGIERLLRVGQDLRLGPRQRQLHAQILELLELRQSRQVIQFLQAEVVEKLARRAEQLRLARHVAMTDHPDPVSLMQGLDDVRIHGDAANLFDFAARDRLAIGDQGQGLEQRARIFGGPLLPQPRDRLRDRRSDLNAETARHFQQLQPARLVLLGQRRDRAFDLLGDSIRRARRTRSSALRASEAGPRRAALLQPHSSRIDGSLSSRKIIVGGAVVGDQRQVPGRIAQAHMQGRVGFGLHYFDQPFTQ